MNVKRIAGLIIMFLLVFYSVVMANPADNNPETFPAQYRFDMYETWRYYKITLYPGEGVRYTRESTNQWTVVPVTKTSKSPSVRVATTNTLKWLNRDPGYTDIKTASLGGSVFAINSDMQYTSYGIWEGLFQSWDVDFYVENVSNVPVALYYHQGYDWQTYQVRRNAPPTPIIVTKPANTVSVKPIELEFNVDVTKWEQDAGLQKGIHVIQIHANGTEKFIGYIPWSNIGSLPYKMAIPEMQPGVTTFKFIATNKNGGIEPNAYIYEYPVTYNPAAGTDASFKAQIVRSMFNKPLIRMASSVVNISTFKKVPGDFNITISYTKADDTAGTKTGTYPYPDQFYSDVGLYSFESHEKTGYRYYELSISDLKLDANNKTTADIFVDWSFVAKNINLTINGRVKIPAGTSVKHILNDLLSPSDWYLQDTPTPIAEGRTGTVTVPGEGTPGQNTGTEQNPYPVEGNILTSLTSFLAGLLAVIGSVIKLGLRILGLIAALFTVPSTSTLLDQNFVDGFMAFRNVRIGQIHIWNTISGVFSFGYAVIIFKMARRNL